MNFLHHVEETGCKGMKKYVILFFHDMITGEFTDL